MDVVSLSFISIAVVAVVEFLKRLNAKDWQGAVTILVAAVVGGAAGFFKIQGLDLMNGIIAGLAAVGVHQVARQIGPTA